MGLPQEVRRNEMLTVMRCFENSRVVLSCVDALTLFREMRGDPDATDEQLEEAVESGEYAYYEMEYSAGASVDLDTAIGV
jgi:hypothetical protein